MEMRVMQQGGSPGMKYGEEANLGTQMFGVGGNGAQGFGRGLEEDVINHLLGPVSDRGNLVRHREDDVVVLAVEKSVPAVFDPLGAGQRLALGAMSIAA
jgi:hypothetical protein